MKGCEATTTAEYGYNYPCDLKDGHTGEHQTKILLPNGITIRIPFRASPRRKS